jgi:hypothetical protein
MQLFKSFRSEGQLNPSEVAGFGRATIWKYEIFQVAANCSRPSNGGRLSGRCDSSYRARWLAVITASCFYVPATVAIVGWVHF